MLARVDSSSLEEEEESAPVLLLLMSVSFVKVAPAACNSRRNSMQPTNSDRKGSTRKRRGSLMSLGVLTRELYKQIVSKHASWFKDHATLKVYMHASRHIESIRRMYAVDTGYRNVLHTALTFQPQIHLLPTTMGVDFKKCDQCKECRFDDGFVRCEVCKDDICEQCRPDGAHTMKQSNGCDDITICEGCTLDEDITPNEDEFIRYLIEKAGFQSEKQAEDAFQAETETVRKETLEGYGFHLDKKTGKIVCKRGGTYTEDTPVSEDEEDDKEKEESPSKKQKVSIE